MGTDAGPDTVRQEGRRFLLLCGCPRSGTTLLSREVARQLGVSIPLETHFIPHFQRHIALWSSIHRSDRMRMLAAAVEAYSWIWVYHGIRGRAPERLREISLIPVLGETDGRATSFGELLNLLYSSFARRQGVDRYGDKSAPFEPEDLELYDRALASMRVVHIIRDGRDVYLSWHQHWFGPRTVGEAAWIWRRHIDTRRRWGMANPDRYLEIRYEDLIREPDVALDRIALFLGLDERRSLAGTLAQLDPIGDAYKYERTHLKLGETVDPGNAGGWRERMNEADRRLFEFIAGPTLVACGYPLATEAVTLSNRVVNRARFATAMLWRYLSVSFYLRRFRALMPIALRLGQLLGLDIVRLARRRVICDRQQLTERR